MASPIWYETLLSAALTSSNVDIVKETIHLKQDNKLRTGNYVITYFIKTNTAGVKVSLLFHAVDYKKKMKIWVDDKEMGIV